MSLPKSLNTAWVADTEPSPDAQDVSTLSAIRIKFAKFLDTTSITNDKFTLHCPSGNVVSDAFETINVIFDYNSLSRVLYLKPRSELSGNSEYTLEISGLLDAAGNVMSSGHIFSFVTASGTSGVINEEYERPDVDQIIVTDYAAQYPSQEGTGYIPISVTSNPVNGQVGVPSSYASGVITLEFSQTGISSDLISVAYIDISSPSSMLTPIDVVIDPTGVSSGTQFTIQMPEFDGITGNYFPQNYVFYIDAIYETIAFTGVLSPLYFSPYMLNGFLNTSLDPIEAARFAYQISSEIKTMLEVNGVTGIYEDMSEVMQLSLYMALYRYTTMSSINDFQLGQLRVMNSSTINSAANPFLGPLQYWWKKVFGGVTPVPIATIDRMNSFFNRNWNYSGIGYPSIPFLQSGRKPRYSRLF